MLYKYIIVAAEHVARPDSTNKVGGSGHETT